MASRFEKLEKGNVQPKEDGKYKAGLDSDRFEAVKHLKPVFAFDYLCEDRSEYSFTGDLIGSSDYRKLLKGLKRVSQNTYTVLNHDKQFHFHDVKWHDVSVKESDFNKCIYGKGEGDGDLTPYQVKLFEEARLIGFLYCGVFYMVMLDRGHNAYKQK